MLRLSFALPALLSLGALAPACGDAPLRTIPELDDDANAEDPRFESCDVRLHDGSSAPGLCGTLVIGAGEAALRVPVKRLKAQTPAANSLPIVVLGNGPGQSNFQWSPVRFLLAGFDVVQVGYRGVDSSVTLECTEFASVMRDNVILSEQHLARVEKASKDCIERFRRTGHDLDMFSVDFVADDILLALKHLEYDRIHLLSDGFGIEVARALIAKAPQRIEAVVATSPMALGPVLMGPTDYTALLEAWSTTCRTSKACGTDESLAELMATTKLPGRWGFTTLDPGRIELVTSLALLQRDAAVRILDAWMDAGRGEFAALGLASWLAEGVGQNVMAWGDALAKTRTLIDAAELSQLNGPAGKNAAPVLRLLARSSRALPRPKPPLPLPTDLTPAGEEGLEPVLSEDTPQAPATQDTGDGEERNARRPRALFLHGSLEPNPGQARQRYGSLFSSVEEASLDGFVLASEAWLHHPREMGQTVSTYFGADTVDVRVPRSPLDFAPPMALGTLHTLLLTLTFAVPAFLGILALLLFRRVRRTMEQERDGKFAPGDSDQSS